MKKYLKNREKIFVFSSVHPWNDGRIFFRQILSLNKKYNIEYHAVSDMKFQEIKGIQIYGLPKWKSFYDRLINLYLLLIRILKSEADVYHFHDPELIIFAPIIKLIKRKKVVFDVHEHYPLMILEKKYILKIFRKIISWIYIIAESILLLFVDRVFFVTKQVGQRYKKIKGNNAVEVINVPPVSILKNQPLDIDKREKIIIYMGYLTFEKGIKEIISAMQYVNKQLPNYKLHLHGSFYSNTFKKEIIKHINKLNLNNIVKLKGAWNYDQMEAITKKAMIGLVTYLYFPNNIVGLPNKLFEYLGAGIGVIASDFENYKDILLKNQCGQVVNPENPKEIANAILNYVNNSDYLKKTTFNARKAFLEKYNWEKQEVSFLNAYADLMKN